MKNKVLTTKTPTFLQTGGNKMVGKQSAGPVASGTTGSHRNGGGKFHAGGPSGKMTGNPVKAAVPGKIGGGAKGSGGKGK